ncbi:hypothetical protein CPB85DRAFT_1437143 [Mucidula mucida]|nr:hypothetical protein CPB85DRAFT_1437143 [Mucidula mucida]
MANKSHGRSPYPLRNQAHNQAESASAVIAGTHNVGGESSSLSSITDTPAQFTHPHSASLGSQDAPLTSTPRRRSQSISGEPRIRVPFKLDADNKVVDDTAPVEGFSPGDSQVVHRGQGIDPSPLHSHVDSVSYNTDVVYPVASRCCSCSLPVRSDNEIDLSYPDDEIAEIDWTPEQHAAFEAAEKELENEQH